MLISVPGYNYTMKTKDHLKLLCGEVNTLKYLKDSAAEMGVNLHSATIAQVLHQSKLYWRVPKTKPLLNNAHLD